MRSGYRLRVLRPIMRASLCCVRHCVLQNGWKHRFLLFKHLLSLSYEHAYAFTLGLGDVAQVLLLLLAVFLVGGDGNMWFGLKYGVKYFVIVFVNLISIPLDSIHMQCLLLELSIWVDHMVTN